MLIEAAVAIGSGVATQPSLGDQLEPDPTRLFPHPGIVDLQITESRPQYRDRESMSFGPAHEIADSLLALGKAA